MIKEYSKILLAIALVISIGMFLFTLGPLAVRTTQTSSERRGQDDADRSHIAGGSIPDTVETKALRQVRDGKQVASRVRSLLNLRAGEVGTIIVPAGELDRWFGSTDQDRYPDSVAVIASITSMHRNDAVTTAMEGILEGNGEVRAQVGGAIRTESSGSNMLVSMMTKEDHPEYSVISLGITSNGLQRQTSATVPKGYSVLVRSVDPEADGILIVVGSDSN